MSTTTEVRERRGPCWTAEEVRAALDGRKTQFRVPVEPQPDAGPNGRMVNLGGDWWGLLDGVLSGEWRCPYGSPGDRLWVREGFAFAKYRSLRPGMVWYRADGERQTGTQLALSYIDREDLWRSPATMPRWAARLWLEITDVRVERVQEITIDDALAEGCMGTRWNRHPQLGPCTDDGELPDEEFLRLWDDRYAKRGYPWESNPWNWVYDFERVDPLRAEP